MAGVAPEDRCTILFSGGSDSALVAAMAMERFQVMDLLTCDRNLMFFVENAGRTAARFADRFGTDRVNHAFFDINEVFHRVFLGEMSRDLPRYQTHLTLLVCLGCKMAMHAAAIVHNVRNGIGTTWDGARRETSWYPAQMASVKEKMKAVHARYGLALDSPVYDIEGTDDRLYELGLVQQKQLKGQFLLHDTQPSCLFGSISHVYTRLFYGPFWGNDVREKDALDYFAQKEPAIVAWIDEQLGRSPDRAGEDA
jgi:hypothetical protein